MESNEITEFVDTTITFFTEISGEPAKCGIPFVKSNDPVVLQFTGLIGITGKRKGSIYYTAGKEQLEALAKIMLDLADVSNEDMKDLVGEVANTVSGNLRQSFGSDFQISVPVVVEGPAKDIKMPKDIDTYVLPINWRDYESFLVVCLE
jgi:chemotaxis protein CheX